MTYTGTGWEIDRRMHFNEIVVNYDRIQLEYPIELFEDVFKYSGPEKRTKSF